MCSFTLVFCFQNVPWCYCDQCPVLSGTSPVLPLKISHLGKTLVSIRQITVKLLNGMEQKKVNILALAIYAIHTHTHTHAHTHTHTHTHTCSLISQFFSFIEFIKIIIGLIVQITLFYLLSLPEHKFHGGRLLDFYLALVFTSEKAMAPHSSTVAWKIPWMEEPRRL